MDNKIKKSDIVKFIIFAIFLISVITCGVIFSSQIKEKITFESVRNFVGENKIVSSLLFVLLQVLQVVIFIIPGDVINATGGFLFNIFLGSILSFIGVVIGSLIAFCTAFFVISLKVTLVIFSFSSIKIFAKCHAIASPSRSGSVAI